MKCTKFDNEFCVRGLTWYQCPAAIDESVPQRSSPLSSPGRCSRAGRCCVAPGYASPSGLRPDFARGSCTWLSCHQTLCRSVPAVKERRPPSQRAPPSPSIPLNPPLEWLLPYAPHHYNMKGYHPRSLHPTRIDSYQSPLADLKQATWQCKSIDRPGGRVTNAVGTISRKILVGTRVRPI